MWFTFGLLRCNVVFTLYSIRVQVLCAYSCLWIAGTHITLLPIDYVTVLKQLLLRNHLQFGDFCDDGYMQLVTCIGTFLHNQYGHNHIFRRLYLFAILVKTWETFKVEIHQVIYLIMCQSINWCWTYKYIIVYLIFQVKDNTL